MLNSIVRSFYPGISKDEVKKFSLLATTLLCLVGAYWIARLVKDVIMFKVAFPETLGWKANQGRIFQPTAKIISPFFLFLVVGVYNVLISKYKKTQLFWIVCGFYSLVFAVLSAVLFANSYLGEQAIGRTIMAIVGWVSYFSIESFGSICIPLFWSYTISTTSNDSAKVGFPMIVAGAQIGAIAGSLLTVFNKKIGGVWPLLAITCVLVALVPFLISYFVKTIPAHLQTSSKDVAAEEKKEDKEDKKEGLIKAFTEGIKLLFTRSYLIGVLGISTLYEIVVTILDFQNKAAGDQMFGTEQFASFLGWFGVATNGLAFVMALLGTSKLIKKKGLQFCLLFYPIVLAIGIVLFMIVFKYGNLTPYQTLAAVFGLTALGKGLSYAVNNPVKEMMYIPTSKEAKYKAKSWIETFGSRGSKAAGGSICKNIAKDGLDAVMLKGNMIGLAIIGVWTASALFVGRKNAQLIKEGKIVE